jgi:hypothetical protein
MIFKNFFLQRSGFLIKINLYSYQIFYSKNRTMSNRLSRKQQQFSGDLLEFIEKYEPQTLDIDWKQNKSGGFSAKLYWKKQYWKNGKKTSTIIIKHDGTGPARVVSYIPAEEDLIYKALCEEFPWLTEPHRRANLYGLVQSGKSRAIMAILWCSIYQWRLRPYLFCLNSVKSYNQVFGRDIKDFDAWLQSMGEASRKLTINGLRRGVDLNDPTCVTVLMNNKYQQLKINRETTTPYLIVGDEGDTLVKHWDFIQDSTSTGRSFHEFEANSHSTWMVTATPMALLNEAGVTSQTFSLSISPNYRDIRQFEKHFLTDEEHESLLKDNTMLVQVVQRALEICNVEHTWHYSSLLINTRYLMEDHREIARTLQAAGIGSYTVNSSGIIYYPPGGGVEKMTSNVYALYNHFEDLYEEDGVYRNHIIIAKRAANRAVSFRPQPGKGYGGLIGEILLPSANGASRVQELRMCGNYSNDFPRQHLFMSRKDYQKLADEVLFNIPNMVEANRTRGEARNQIEGVPIIANGPHDRPNVDDTTVANRHAMNKTLFDTEELCAEFCREKGFQIHDFTMTDDQLIQVPLTDEEKVLLEDKPSGYQRRIRNRIEATIGHQGGGFNVGWPGTDRLEELLRMTWRFNSNNAWAASKYVAAISDDGQYMNIVQWKDGFYEPDTANGRRPKTREDRTIDFEQSFPLDVSFMFLSPEGKWMYFVRDDDRVTGTLAHRDA